MTHEQMTPERFAELCYRMWRSGQYARSAQFIFDAGRRLISMADAEMIKDLKKKALEVPVQRFKAGKLIEGAEPDGVLEDEWGILP